MRWQYFTIAQKINWTDTYFALEVHYKLFCSRWRCRMKITKLYLMAQVHGTRDKMINNHVNSDFQRKNSSRAIWLAKKKLNKTWKKNKKNKLQLATFSTSLNCQKWIFFLANNIQSEAIHWDGKNNNILYEILFFFGWLHYAPLFGLIEWMNTVKYSIFVWNKTHIISYSIEYSMVFKLVWNVCVLVHALRNYTILQILTWYLPAGKTYFIGDILSYGNL